MLLLTQPALHRKTQMTENTQMNYRTQALDAARVSAQAQENEQRLLLENSLRLVEEGFWRHAAQLRAKTPQGGMMEALPESRGLRYCVDMLHLTDAELTEWNEMVRTFMDAHDGAHAAAGARSYHCALIWYEAGADEAQSAGTAGRQNEKK